MSSKKMSGRIMMSECQLQHRWIRSTGQSLSEYLMIGAIVAVLGIGAYLLLGSALKDALAGVKGSMTGNLASAQKYATETASMTGPTSVLGPTTMQIGDTTVYVSNYPLSMEASIQTVGANGTTDLLAVSLKEMAEQLLAAGEITQKQFDLLLNLSNAGHTLASGMQIIESAADEATASAWMDAQKIDEFATKKGVFLSKERSVAAIGYQLKSKYIYDAEGNIIGKTAFGKFSTLLNKVNKDKKMPESLKAIVAQLGGEVKTLSSGLGAKARKVTSTAKTSSSTSTSAKVVDASAALDEIAVSEDSVTVNENSAHICVAGYWQDTGEECVATTSP
jgi:hypothetical protein